jgi:6-phosphogluconolactonase
MGASIEVKIYENPKKVVKALAKKLYKIIKETTQPKFNIALSGGKTPKLLFEVLVSKYSTEIPWQKIHLWWGDERCVPPDNKESNFKLASDKLISQVLIPEENIHRIKGENIPVEEANRYSQEIEAFLNMRSEWPVFDLIILGLGDDGHTASIFPDQTELLDFKLNCAVTEHPITGQKRITLTGKVLNNANRIFFLVTGKNKAMRISEIMNDDEAAKLLPAYYIEPQNGELIWYIDQDAASLIA